MVGAGGQVGGRMAAGGAAPALTAEFSSSSSFSSTPNRSIVSLRCGGPGAGLSSRADTHPNVINNSCDHMYL
jgi:hypothetical protein